LISACAHTSQPALSSGTPFQTATLSAATKTMVASSASNNGKEDPAAATDPFEKDPFEADPFGDSASNVQDNTQVADPLEGWNRMMFTVNDKLYFWVLKPVSKGYRVVVPTPVRVGIKNFFTNLLAPLRIANCLLQNKGDAAGAELFRFIMNSTMGVLGFGNPAQKYPELNVHDEDFGQTFGHWGMGNGFYIVWPILGPSTLRDSIGLVGEPFLTPYYYVKPGEVYYELWTLNKTNTISFQIGDYESLKEASLDPYQAFRNAYIQYRNDQVAK
jgi:phospholipid-binding lipoprotein MlaA